MVKKQTPPIKKTPERRCIGCGERFPKTALIRIVRAPDGTISLDRTGKKSGRGAYLCYSAECLRRARKANRLTQNLECEIPNEIYNKMEAELTNNV